MRTRVRLAAVAALVAALACLYWPLSLDGPAGRSDLHEVPEGPIPPSELHPGSLRPGNDVRAPDLAVRCVDEEGRPVTGARIVRLRFKGGETVDVAIAFDRGGEASVSRSRHGRPWSFDVEAKGYEPQTVTLEASDRGPPREVRVVLVRSTNVVVVVEGVPEDFGRPRFSVLKSIGDGKWLVVDATVTGEAHPLRVRVRGLGEYRIAGEIGPAARGVVAVVDVRIGPETPAEVEAVLRFSMPAATGEGAPVEIVVLDEAGAAVSGAELGFTRRLQHPNGPHYHAGVAMPRTPVTDSTGAWSGPLPDGFYTLYVTAAGYVMGLRVFVHDAHGTRLRVTMARADRVVVLRVRPRGGWPAPQEDSIASSVTLHHRSDPTTYWQTVGSGSAGRGFETVEFRISHGEYALLVQPSRRFCVTALALEPLGPGERREVEVVLEPGRVLEVRTNLDPRTLDGRYVQVSQGGFVAQLVTVTKPLSLRDSRLWLDGVGPAEGQVRFRLNRDEVYTGILPEAGDGPEVVELRRE